MRGNRNFATSLSPLSWLGLGLGLAAWCLLVASLSALQNGCNTGAQNGNPGVVYGYLSEGAPLGCSRIYRFPWFIIFFELVVLFLVFLALVSGMARSARVALVACVAIATLLLIELTNSFLIFKDVTSGSLNTRVAVFFSGALIGAVANFLIIFGLGTHGDDVAYGDGYGTGTRKAVDVPVGTGPGAAPAVAHPTTGPAEPIV